MWSQVRARWSSHCAGRKVQGEKTYWRYDTSAELALWALLPDTQNCGLRMRRECREHFSRHRRISDPDIHHRTCVTHVPWCMPGSLTSGFLWNRWRGRRSRHSRRMRNPQFCVSAKRPMWGYPMTTEMRSFLCCQPAETIKQTVDVAVIWDAILLVSLLWSQSFHVDAQNIMIH